MIKLTRLDGTTIFLNHTNIQWVETTPDTTITVINGARIIVKETIAEVLSRIEKRVMDENKAFQSEVILQSDISH